MLDCVKYLLLKNNNPVSPQPNDADAGDTFAPASLIGCYKPHRQVRTKRLEKWKRKRLTLPLFRGTKIFGSLSAAPKRFSRSMTKQLQVDLRIKFRVLQGPVKLNLKMCIDATTNLQ